jgi:hypothetical protein
MRFDHKISYLKLQQCNYNTIFPENEYLGLSLQLKLYRNNDLLGMYLCLKLPYGYENIDISIKVGIINENDNLCRSQKLEKVWTTNDFGKYHGFRDIIPISQLGRYLIDDNIVFSYQIMELKYQHSIELMIQRMYRLMVNSDTRFLTESLERQVLTLSQNNNDLRDRHLANVDEIHRLQKQLQKQNRDSHANANASASASVSDLDAAKTVFMDTINRAEMGKIKEISEMIQSINQKLTLRTDQLLNCVICKDVRKDCLFLPCKHICTCTKCAEQVEECSICRATIEDRIPTYG